MYQSLVTQLNSFTARGPDNSKTIWVERLILMGVGALLSFAFAPFSAAPVIFIALPLIYVLIDQADTGRLAFARAWWFGFGLMLAGVHWIGTSFTQQDFFPVYLAPPAILLMTGALACYYGLTAALFFWFKTRSGCSHWQKYFVFAACWTVVEVARSYLIFGFPWHLIGAIWADWLAPAQLVYYLSIFGTSFITVLVALLPLMVLDVLALSIEKPTHHRVLAMIPALAIAVVFASLVYMGDQRMKDNPTTYHGDVPMRLVQGNIKQIDKWQENRIDDHFYHHIRLSRGPSKTGRGTQRATDSASGRAMGKRLVIWPETAVQRETFDWGNSIERYVLSRLLDKGSYAITGVPRVELRGGRYRYFNSLMAINPDGDLYARYDKSYLVPGGEYLPLSGLLEAIGLSTLTGQYFTPGDGVKTVSLPGVPPFSPLICYEIIFPGRVLEPLKPGKARPEWMLNITNDAWFGTTIGPYQHLALARLRAIEEGLPVIRVANSGISAVIDPVGRLVNQTSIGVVAVLDVDLPKSLQNDVISSGMKILMVLFLMFTLLTVTIIRRNSNLSKN